MRTKNVNKMKARPADYKWVYPRYSLERQSGNMHVRTSVEEIIATLTEKAASMPYQWQRDEFTPLRIRRCALYIKVCHYRHIRLMKEVNIIL